MVHEGFLYRFHCDMADKSGKTVDSKGQRLCPTPDFMVIINRHSSKDRAHARKIVTEKGWVEKGKKKVYCPHCAKRLKLIPGADLESDVLLVDRQKVNDEYNKLTKGK